MARESKGQQVKTFKHHEPAHTLTATIPHDPNSAERMGRIPHGVKCLQIYTVDSSRYGVVRK